jgi:hypothetical protein
MNGGRGRRMLRRGRGEVDDGLFFRHASEVPGDGC